MKKIFLLLVLFSFNQQGKSQTITWCPAGASWIYNYNWFADYGYSHLTYVGDTIINGFQAQEILQENHYYNFMNHDSEMQSSRNYFYEDNGVIYGKTEYMNDVDTIYNFNLVPGDKYGVGFSECGDTDVWTISDTGHIFRNGILLKFQIVSTISFHQPFTDSVIERIGFLSIDPFYNSNCITDIGYGGLCNYSDLTFSPSYPNSDSTCTILPVTGISVISKKSFQYFPNPVNDFINLTWSGRKSFIRIYNSIGEEILYLDLKNISSSELKLNTVDWAEGIYLIQCDDEIVKVFKHL